MAKRRDNPRKRRTREHVIAAQSANYVERFIVRSGYACQPVLSDYGYDLVVFTFDDDGYAENGSIYIQLKATEGPTITSAGVAFDLDVRDYNRWADEPMPVFLVVYDAANERAYWLYVQQYFESAAGRRPPAGAKTIRVHLPETNRVGMAFVRYARERKEDVLRHLHGKVQHHG